MCLFQYFYLFLEAEIMKSLYTILTLFLCSSVNSIYAQTTLEQVQHMQSTPKHYGVLRTSTPIQIDGKADEDSWQQAAWTDSFIDIEGKHRPHPTYDTKVKMLWDDEYLYLYAQLEEPHVWGNLTERDTIIYHNNDFEVFLKPFNNSPLYYEIEINPLNTVMDLLMPNPYRLGGDALMHWDVKDLKTAVHIEGTLNNPNDTDRYWTVEMAIPFRSLSTYSRRATPKVDDYWQINFSRVQWQHNIIDGRYSRKKQEGKLLHEDNWVWSAIGIINMHFPERWGYIQFLNNQKESTLPVHYLIEKNAWNIFYLQQLYRKSNAHYANSLEDLNSITNILPVANERWSYSFLTNTENSLYQVEVHDKSQGLRATIDNYGNYMLHGR